MGLVEMVCWQYSIKRTVPWMPVVRQKPLLKNPEIRLFEFGTPSRLVLVSTMELSLEVIWDHKIVVHTLLLEMP